MVAVLVVVLVVLLAAAALSAPLRATALDRAAARRDGHGSLPDAAVEEVALITGGPARVVETSVARLVEGGLVAVAPDRTLHATGRAPHGDLDRAVLAAVASPPPPATSAVVTRVRHGREVDAVADGARRRGLVHDTAVLARVRRDALLALGVVAVAGVVVPAVLLGAQAGAAPGVVALLGGVVGAVLVVTAVPARRATPRGRATLAAATAQPAWGRLPAPSAGVTANRSAVRGPALAVDAAGLVAIGGLARFPDPDVASLLTPPPSGYGGSGGGLVGGDGGGGGGCGGDGGGGGGGSC